MTEDPSLTSHSATARITCIGCGKVWMQTWAPPPTERVVDVTCPECGTGWGLDLSTARADRAPNLTEALKAVVGGPAPEAGGVPSAPVYHLGRPCRVCGADWNPDALLTKAEGALCPGAPAGAPGSLSPPPTPSRTHAEKEPPPQGWGPVLTLEKVEEICTHIEKALPMDWACRLCDVSPETLTSARRLHASLDARIEKARAKGGASLVGTLHADTMASRNVTRSTFLLERLYPKQFHLPIVVTGVGGAPVGADPTEKEPAVKRRWMLNFMAEHGRWPFDHEKPEGEE